MNKESDAPLWIALSVVGLAALSLGAFFILPELKKRVQKDRAASKTKDWMACVNARQTITDAGGFCRGNSWIDPVTGEWQIVDMGAVFDHARKVCDVSGAPADSPKRGRCLVSQINIAEERGWDWYTENVPIAPPTIVAPPR